MNRFFSICTYVLMFSGVVVCNPRLGNSQEYLLFETENQAANAVFGWDLFAGGYPQAHESSLDEGGAFLTASPAGGLISSSANLYAFFTIPTYTFSLSKLDDTEGFSTVVIQIATTESIDEFRFDLPPDEFVELGARADLLFGEDVIPINYYWAEWNSLEAAENFDVSLVGMEMHVSFCSARAAHFNSAMPLDVTFGKQELLGDVNCDGDVNLLDVAPFVDAVSSGVFNSKADMNQDGAINLLDVEPFIAVLSG